MIEQHYNVELLRFVSVCLLIINCLIENDVELVVVVLGALQIELINLSEVLQLGVVFLRTGKSEDCCHCCIRLT